MSGKESISKQKGVDECVKMMYSGLTRKDILPKFTKAYGLSVSCIEKWMRAAQPEVERLRKADEETASRVRSEQTEEVARRLGISREWLLAKLKCVADMDVRKLFKEDGTMKKPGEWDDETAQAIAGIEVFEERTVNGKIGTSKKVKADPRITASIEIGKLMGYYPQSTAKVEIDEKDGKKVARKVSVTLNLS